MKFSCNVDDFINKLSISTRVLSSKATSPILDGACLVAGDDVLDIICSNGMMSVVSRIDASVEEPGGIVLPGRFLLDVSRRLPQGEVSFSSNAQNFCTIRCRDFNMKMAGRQESDYPRLPVVSSEQYVTLRQSVFRDMINRTAFAMAVDDPRTVLNGCYLEVADGCAKMVALDGFRLAVRKEQADAGEYELKAIIPSKTVYEIAKVLTDDDESEARIMSGGSQMLIDLGTTKVYTKLVEGTYLKYDTLLQGKFVTSIQFDRDEMTSCIERAALIAREGNNKLIVFDVTPEHLTIKANSETSDLSETMFFENRGESMVIAFNVTYVTDVMRALPEGQAVLKLSSPVSSSLVLPLEGDSFAYIMLPVRIGA
ncbi:MAG: DNA polymerase III subunit beta [Clostridia bacterium]|nr:DNA polymerase III subunit beta [Clostridia bacterium]